MRTGRILLAACLALAPFVAAACELDDSGPVPWAQMVATDGAVGAATVDAGTTEAWPGEHEALEPSGRAVLGYDPALVPLGPPHAPLRTRATEALADQCALGGGAPASCHLLEGSEAVGDGVAAGVLVTRPADAAADETVERLDLAIRGAEGWRIVARVSELQPGARVEADVHVVVGPHGPWVTAVVRTAADAQDRAWDEVTTVERSTLVVAADRGSGMEALAVVPLAERVLRSVDAPRMIGPNVPPPVVAEEALGWRLDPSGRLSLWVVRGAGDLATLAGDHALAP